MPAILVIDDNDTIRDGLAHTIKKMGHDAVTAASGAAGVEAFKHRGFDFVITDLKLEGMGGVEVLKAIAALDADVPIMLITAYGTVEIDVINRGPEIPADQREKIFDPFFTTREKGTGLGLAFVREIARDHGGDVEVTCAGGETRFRVTLREAT